MSEPQEYSAGLWVSTFGGKKAWEAVPLFSLSLQVAPAQVHFLSGHFLCPVHEATLTDQLCTVGGVLGARQGER